jgi:hypothetical protein
MLTPSPHITQKLTTLTTFHSPPSWHEPNRISPSLPISSHLWTTTTPGDLPLDKLTHTLNPNTPRTHRQTLPTSNLALGYQSSAVICTSATIHRHTPLHMGLFPSALPRHLSTSPHLSTLPTPAHPSPLPPHLTPFSLVAAWLGMIPHIQSTHLVPRTRLSQTCPACSHS